MHKRAMESFSLKYQEKLLLISYLIKNLKHFPALLETFLIPLTINLVFIIIVDTNVNKNNKETQTQDNVGVESRGNFLSYFNVIFSDSHFKVADNKNIKHFAHLAQFQL
ncbi:CLUMA_CG003220, isoform A [Clunio marinus]|uniref:CLUMA_CG003220, isoform A n=1 Tax=Clunio marinus TaxID=568069 RepID=A0A1J1HQ15_9DIPT|nr:CLUMA_CG003220, isoform A [Clunio marinus]